MRKTQITKTLVLFVAGILTASVMLAQGDKSSRPSPPAEATGKIGAATVKISYSSPAVKGRPVLNGLIPYGKAWRAGANEATILETDKDLKVEGKALPAGKYSLFVIAGEKEWNIILNSETGQWGIKRSGEANFDPAKNVVSVNVKPGKAAKMNERLNYEVTDKGFVLRWENVEVPVSVK